MFWVWVGLRNLGGVPDGAEDNDCPAYADAACFTSAAIHTGSI